MVTIDLRTASVDETHAVAGALADLAEPGDVLLLAGDLGAGKTAFTQGFGRALGVDTPIVSPTFTLARQYQGRLTMHHLDVYRLDRVHEIFDVGLPEMLDEGGVVLIEWGDVVRGELPDGFLQIDIAMGDGDDDRSFVLQTVGPQWQQRWDHIGGALEEWRC